MALDGSGFRIWLDMGFSGLDMAWFKSVTDLPRMRKVCMGLVLTGLLVKAGLGMCLGVEFGLGQEILHIKLPRT